MKTAIVLLLVLLFAFVWSATYSEAYVPPVFAHEGEWTPVRVGERINLVHGASMLPASVEVYIMPPRSDEYAGVPYSDYNGGCANIVAVTSRTILFSNGCNEDLFVKSFVISNR